MLWSPREGIRQWDPFSPALFVLLASVIMRVLQSVHPDLHVGMYDLVVYMSCSSTDAVVLLEDIVHALYTFGLHTGLRMNSSKCKVLFNGLDLQQFV